MITTVTLGSVSLKCDNVIKPPKRKTVTIQIPGRTDDIVQDLGQSSKVISLTGIINGAAKDTDKATLEGYVGTVVAYADGVDNINVYVQEVNIPTTGGMPNHYVFNISMIKYNQT